MHTDRMFHFSEPCAFAGPKEELDKLAQVNWSLVSFATTLGPPEQSDISSIADLVRVGDNQLLFTLDTDAYGQLSDICVPDDWSEEDD